MCNECYWTTDNPLRIERPEDGYEGNSVDATVATHEEIQAGGWEGLNPVPIYPYGGL